MTATRSRVLSAGWSRTKIELTRFIRSREELGFTLALPVVLLLMLGTILDGEIDNTGVSFRSYLLAGIAATIAINVGINSLGPQLVMDRSDGTVKRLMGTPMPPAAYLIGKLGYTLVVAVVELGLVIAVGALALGVPLPDVDGWLTMAWVFPLGLIASTALGIALATVVDDPKAAGPIVTLPFVVLQFISGVFFVFTDLPGWLQTIASIFPLRWLAQGMRSVFLPDSFQVAEVNQTWDLWTVALLLLVWTVGGLVVAVTRFRTRTL